MICQQETKINDNFSLCKEFIVASIHIEEIKKLTIS